MFAGTLAVVVSGADSPVTQELRSRRAMLVAARHLKLSLSCSTEQGGPLLPATAKTSLTTLPLIQDLAK